MDKVLDMKKKCEIKIKNKQENRALKQLMRIKRKVKKATGEMRNIRLKLLNVLVTNNKEQKRACRIKRTVKELRRAGGGTKKETF